MTNHDRPWGGEPQGEHPTEQFWQGNLPPAAQDGSAGPAGQPQPGWQATPGGRRRAAGWALGLVAAAVLAAGGIAAGVALTSHPDPAAMSGAASGAAPGGQTGGGQATGGKAAAPGASEQGALLSATLGSAGAPGRLRVSASPAAAPRQGTGAGRAGVCARVRHWARAARRAGFRRVARARRIAAHRCHLLRRLVFRFYLLHGVDGQFTIQTHRGLKTVAFERGVVQSVSSSGLVVKAIDGTIWTWHFMSTTVVRDRGGKVARSAVTDGEPVWAGGPVLSGAKDARLIIVRPPTASG